MIAKPGRPSAEIVAEVLENAIRNFPWPKSMRWGAGSLRWVRPLHSIICLLVKEDGTEIVPLDIDGIVAGDTTRGHRFMAPDTIRVSSFADYEAKLKRAFVVLNPEDRAETIWHDAGQAAFANGFEVVEDRGLLAEVSGLVEWPVVLMGDIGADFIDLPPEVLQTSMKEHQKFFSVKNPKTGRIEKFVTVANRETTDNGATILAGNQKVLAARLSDAKFFWENDLRTVERQGMDAWLGKLESVTFHAKLGSQAELIDRMAALAGQIAPLVGADVDEAVQAAKVAKADLASEMVYEFPELQGIMGRYYAKNAGLSDSVADACRDHYSPLGPSDAVPTAPVSVAVSLAEKLDKLTGFWAIDEKPTGSKDPYALRRAALGVIRLVLVNELRVSLSELLRGAYPLHIRQIFRAFRIIESTDGQRWSPSWIEDGLPLDRWFYFDNDNDVEVYDFEVWKIDEHTQYRHLDMSVLEATDRMMFLRVSGEQPNTKGIVDNSYTLGSLAAVVPDLLSFIHDRLKVHLRDEGISHDVIEASLAMPGADDLTLLVKRARALAAFLATDDGTNLVQGFKRANNILTQAEKADGVEYSFGADIKFAEADEEKALFAALNEAQSTIAPAMQSEDFAAAMGAMAKLRAPIDAFFEAVQINTDNQIVRRNRLNLLAKIRDTCISVADLTRLDG